MGDWAPSISTLSSPTPSPYPCPNNGGDTLCHHMGTWDSPSEGPDLFKGFQNDAGSGCSTGSGDG
jgi:hypothetical protein